MKSQDIRRSFVEYFAGHGHRVESSAPLVPHGDQTLLFTNAGMVPFKDYFLGQSRPPQPRAVSVQKCMRVSGKHNDLENVGPSHRHHTFFEMLGNFSFGDYFKEDAIRFGWELVTEGWGIAPERLWATVFEEDEEAERLWPAVTALPAERVIRCGAADNFWAMGDTGPCGPCSEIFVDIEPELPQVPFAEGESSGRYLEIWNLVFMQFERHEGGELVELPNPSIDTGAGLERVAAVLQNHNSNYDTDLFRPLIDATAALGGIGYGADSSTDVSFRVIADHLRAVSFLLADGVIPSNEGRGYVLRRILRRALRHGMSLGFDEPFLHRLVPIVGETMGGAYPELLETADASTVSVESEERKFLSTLAVGARQVQEEIGRARARGLSTLSGETLFRLYDTHGLPLEVLGEIAEEEQFTLDQEGFDRELEAQRSRSRAAAGSSRGLEPLRDAYRRTSVSEDEDSKAGETTVFVGYDQLEVIGSRVTWLGGDSKDGPAEVAALAEGARGAAVLDKTPFYAEAGGQLGDKGVLVWEGGQATVGDTQKADGVVFHQITVAQGKLDAKATVSARVDPRWRRPTQRNHTATHLLHAALRKVLGSGVRQAGSLVAPDRLRFDFTYGKPLSDEEVERVENLVNRWVLQAEATVITDGRSHEEAIAAGAMALFGEKYGDQVRTVAIPPLLADEATEELSSLELCGGCHVANTGEIGLFVVVSERAVASGVRRIEARTGDGARSYFNDRRAVLRAVSSALGVAEGEVIHEVEVLTQKKRDLEGELKKMRLELVSGASPKDQEILIDGIKVVTREVPPAPADEIRNMADVLRGKLGSGVVVLAFRDKDKVSLVAAVSKDLTARIHAGNLAREIATLVDGKGGGRPDFAQAGGRQPDQLPSALDAVPGLVRRLLGAV